MTKPSDKSASPKSSHVFPAPEWTGVSADIAASLAHEIRNPLLAIKGAAQLLGDAVTGDDKALTELIITEAKRIEQLVAQMDPLTPNPTLTMAPLNIHEITEYVRLAAESSFAQGVKFIVQYDPSLPPVLGVREGLIQALMNLVKNAAEAVSNMDATGEPLPWERQRGLASGSTLSRSGEGDAPHADSRPHPDFLVAAEEAAPENPTSPKGEASAAAPFVPTITLTTRYLIGERMQRIGGGKLPIQVRIEDNGPGVDAAMIPRLFTPFASSKEGGKGLGLAIVAKIIEEHRGLVAYESAPGKPAIFSLYLPAV